MIEPQFNLWILEKWTQSECVGAQCYWRPTEIKWQTIETSKKIELIDQMKNIIDAFIWIIYIEEDIANELRKRKCFASVFVGENDFHVVSVNLSKCIYFVLLFFSVSVFQDQMRNRAKKPCRIATKYYEKNWRNNININIDARKQSLVVSMNDVKENEWRHVFSLSRGRND